MEFVVPVVVGLARIADHKAPVGPGLIIADMNETPLVLRSFVARFIIIFYIRQPLQTRLLRCLCYRNALQFRPMRPLGRSDTHLG